MALTIRSGDPLSTLATRDAKPGLEAPAAAVEKTLEVPGSKDAFHARPVHHDKSAQAALHQLEQHAGPTISARELMRAIDRGTADFDGNMAGREYRDFAQWTQDHASQLTEGAKQVMALYTGAAKTAQSQKHDGVTSADRTKLLHRMAMVNGGAPPPAVAPKTGSGSTAKQWQAAAMKSPAHLFKRQVHDPRWNNDPDAPSRSGHCAIASLAMAVEAFGLEKKGLDTPGHTKDQDTIDAVAAAMPNKIMKEAHGGHTWLTHTSKGDVAGTFPYQMVAAAKKLGLSEATRPSISMHSIDGALAKGHMVCLSGRAGAAFRAAEGHDYAKGHCVLVMGKTADGHYLVCDPLSRKGPTTLTAAQLSSFNTRGYTSTEVWRGS